MDRTSEVIDQAGEALRIFQRSRENGDDFKQSMADAMAGPYDRAAAAVEIDTLVASAPVVIFTWEVSPFSKKALQWLEVAGFSDDSALLKNVVLDKPWSEGNPLRAELGRRTGKTSVPSVFINGEYCGGFDDGPSEEAPGLMKLAFSGQLQGKLESAKAAKAAAAAPAAAKPAEVSMIGF